MSSEFTCRAASPNDYSQVVRLNGADTEYLPAEFYTFVHSRDHVTYVAEVKGKIVSTASAYIPPGQDWVLFMGERTTSAYQGQQVITAVKRLLRANIRQQHPGVTHMRSLARPTAGYLDNLRNHPEKKIMFQMNSAVYKLQTADIKPGPLKRNQPEKLHISRFPKVLTDDVIKRLFPESKFVYGVAWYCDDVTMTSLRRASQWCEVNITSGVDDVITGISFSTHVQAPVGVRSDLMYYGETAGDCLAHVDAMLQGLHSQRDVCPRVALHVHFPLHLHEDVILDYLEAAVGKRMSTGDYTTLLASAVTSKL